MHNYWMRQQGVEGRYIPLAIEPEGLEDALRALPALGFSGCNLTIPHKLGAMSVVDEVDEVGQKIGAISCVVVREDGSLFGTNNDWLGFLGNLKEAHPAWRGDEGPTAVIGAGGGSRAVCYALLDAGATEIRLVNRTSEEPKAIARDLGGPIKVYDWEDRHDILDGVVVAVNATSQGMDGEPALDIKFTRLPASALVIDIIYTPLETPFLSMARTRGNTTLNGLGMLLHQGPPAWERWFDLKPLVTSELRDILERSIASG